MKRRFEDFWNMVTSQYEFGDSLHSVQLSDSVLYIWPTEFYWFFCFLNKECIFQWVQGLSFLNIYPKLWIVPKHYHRPTSFSFYSSFFGPSYTACFSISCIFSLFVCPISEKNNTKYIFSMIRALGLRVLNYEERHCYRRHYFFSNNLKEVGKAQTILIYTKSYIPSTFWPISFATWPRDSYPETAAVE